MLKEMVLRKWAEASGRPLLCSKMWAAVTAEPWVSRSDLFKFSNKCLKKIYFYVYVCVSLCVGAKRPEEAIDSDPWSWVLGNKHHPLQE